MDEATQGWLETWFASIDTQLAALSLRISALEQQVTGLGGKLEPPLNWLRLEARIAKLEKKTRK